MNDYPSKIVFDNMFTSEDIDLDKFDYPELRVRTWSNVFGKGGAYSIEPVAGSTFSRAILTVNVETDNPSVRANLESLVNDWNVDVRENWIALLHSEAVKQSEYRAKKVAEFDEIVAEARAAKRRVNRLAKLMAVSADV